MNAINKSKLPNIGTNIFTKMSLLSGQFNAINLSQGYPDFDVDPELINLSKKYLYSGFHQYAPMQGVLKLRKAISEKHFQLYEKYYDDEEEITITSGATPAIFTAISAFINPEAFNLGTPGNIKLGSLIEMAIGAAGGSITFSGSVIAFLKLQGMTSGAPSNFKGQHILKRLIVM